MTMKVYVLVLGENYEGYSVLGVYSTMKRAEEQQERKKLSLHCDYYDIIEVEIDKEREDL